jgi:hypothetical protein
VGSTTEYAPRRAKCDALWFRTGTLDTRESPGTKLHQGWHDQRRIAKRSSCRRAAFDSNMAPQRPSEVRFAPRRSLMMLFDSFIPSHLTLAGRQ